ncbi:MAG: hypothetical protein ACTSSE_15170 [Candidatus Thorarchaeota archaeon]
MENFPRAERLCFRVAKFEDMHQQLKNTIKLQHLTHRLSRLRGKKESDDEETITLEQMVKELKQARRSAPPRLLLRDGRVILQIPFLSPNGVVSSKILGGREYTTKGRQQL